MAENGILDYQGMNQAIYRGATSNIIVDTQSMSIEIGAGNSSHTSNLHIECDHDANVASIQLNSNVVTKFSRSKKLIKYPRVALTSASDNAYENGYKVTVSNQHSSYKAWEAFDHNGDVIGWYSTEGAAVAYNGTTRPGLYSGTTRLANETEEGEWIGLELPEAIKLQSVRMTSQSYSSNGNTVDEFIVYAKKQSGDVWTSLGLFTGVAAAQNSAAGVTVNVDAIDYYNFFNLVVTKRHDVATPNLYGISIRELEYYGTPEYDPEAHGTDVTVKSVANVPNTDWLERYYDAKNYSSGSTILDEVTATHRDATINGSVPLDTTGEIKSWSFNGNVSNFISGDDNVDGIPSSGDWVHSMSIWFKTADMSNDQNIAKILPSANLGGSSLATGSASAFYLRGKNNGTSPSHLQIVHWSQDVRINYIFNENEWYHITYAYSGGGVSSTSQRTYINGVYVPLLEDTRSSSTIGDNLNISSVSRVVLGKRYLTGNEKPFNGSIANFRLFNRALTSDEIYQLYAYQKEYFGHGDLSMTLKAGRLGIGTSEPRAALDVRGTLKVNGPATFTGRPNFTESLFFYTGNTPTNYYVSTYKNRHGFYLNTLIPPDSHIGNYGTGGDNQPFSESGYGSSNELCKSHFDCMVYWLKNAPVGHVHRLNWCSKNGSGGSQTYGQKTSGTQIRLWGYWFSTGTYDRDWTSGVYFNISTSTVGVFYEGATFQ